jgi:hypothetical protein
MRLRIYIFSISWVLVSCGDAAVRRQANTTLDSISGVLAVSSDLLLKTDTAALQKAIQRFHEYNAFISQAVTDTLEKNEADELQHFYSAGSRLKSFAANRNLLLSRAALVNQQLKKLRNDAGGGIDTDALRNHLAGETKATAELTQAMLNEKNRCSENLERFRVSLPVVQALIRKRNNGQLPVVIRDTTDL